MYFDWSVKQRTKDVLSFNQIAWSVHFLSMSGQMVEARPCLNNMMQLQGANNGGHGQTKNGMTWDLEDNDFQ